MDSAVDGPATAFESLKSRDRRSLGRGTPSPHASGLPEPAWSPMRIFFEVRAPPYADPRLSIMEWPITPARQAAPQ
ncbi:hypothetical protein DQ384_28700 [Sphaerisporangium album]|uniref:Uncharacterized protein n=1 Tax=Sphaerisporangium album TaxID=509200 RepID=A0A367FBB3_9ACTN|nr:hypothetical protein DQ384_28700 [Sphaerisporangium album]